MSLKNYWFGFWNPKGNGFLLFFSKFILFTLLVFIAWSVMADKYNPILKNISLHMLKDEIPIIDHRYHEDRGTLDVLLQPDYRAPIKPIKNENVAFTIFIDTVHFNFIPFFALLLASPLRSWKRLVTFLVLGSIILSLSHIWHINLDVKAYYYKEQMKKGIFPQQNIQLSPDQVKPFRKWQAQNRRARMFQAFMEQAGSMAIPAFLWMIYASQWILGALLKKEKLQKKQIAGKSGKIPDQ